MNAICQLLFSVSPVVQSSYQKHGKRTLEWNIDNGIKHLFQTANWDLGICCLWEQQRLKCLVSPEPSLVGMVMKADKIKGSRKLSMPV